MFSGFINATDTVGLASTWLHTLRGLRDWLFKVEEDGVPIWEPHGDSSPLHTMHPHFTGP